MILGVFSCSGFVREPEMAMGHCPGDVRIIAIGIQHVSNDMDWQRVKIEDCAWLMEIMIVAAFSLSFIGPADILERPCPFLH
jgi:hypothetical protein